MPAALAIVESEVFMDAKYYQKEIKKMIDDVKQESALEFFFSLILIMTTDQETMRILSGYEE